MHELPQYVVFSLLRVFASIFSTDIISCRPQFIVLQAQQTPAGTELSFTLCFSLTAAISAILE
jgi:hypothetical protein